MGKQEWLLDKLIGGQNIRAGELHVYKVLRGRESRTERGDNEVPG